MPLFIPGASFLYDSGLDNLIQHMRGNGVITGCGVAAHAAPDLGVRVAAGTIQYDGALVAVAQTDLVVGANGSGNSRWDLISVTSAGVPAITQGNPAATPKPPALPANSLALAIVAVAPAAANVQNANIENRRLISTIGQGIIVGTLANRPSAAVQNGMAYFATDDQGGTLYRSNGATWAQAASGVSPVALKYLDQGDKAAVAITVDWTVATSQRFRMTGNPSSLTFTAPPAGTWVGLEVVQDGTGGRVLPAWPAAVKWSGGITPTPTTTLNKKDLYAFYYDGTDYLGSASLNF